MRRSSRQHAGRLVGFTDPLRQPFGFVNGPAPLGIRFDRCQPVVDIFVAVDTLPVRVGVVAEKHERRPVLHRVVHIGRSVRQPDAAEHPEGGLSRGFRIAVRDGDQLAFMSSLDQLQLRVVDERIADRP